MRFAKATALIVVVGLILSLVVFGVTWVAAPEEVTSIQPITSETLCPLAGCSASECHMTDEPPELEPGQTMSCPRKIGCESQECHSEERLVSHYKTANDWSLNIWVVGLSVFVLGLIMIVKRG